MKNSNYTEQVKNLFYQTSFIFAILLMSNTLFAQKITVTQDGTGKYKTIQEAINSLDTASTKQRTIFIKNGVYREKLMITKSFLKLQGESEDGVIILTTLPRDVWRCENKDDFGAATINVKGHDLTFEKLSVINDYGFNAKKDTTIICTNEAGNSQSTLPREEGEKAGKKIVRKDGHQFAFRSFPGATRLSFINCTFRAGGGDTVSPWDVEGGLYYFKNCTMEGHVDFYCPRGWAYAENCKFVCHNMNAAIWHDGSNYESSKTVLKNCTFEGDKGYKLGRFHREAQFYLIDCKFDENMADAEIYQSSTTQLKWGKRVYYYNCHRKGNDFAWYANNLKIDPKAVTIDWTFDGKWNPVNK